MKKTLLFIYALFMSFSLFSCADEDDNPKIQNDTKTDFLLFVDSWNEPEKYTFSYSYIGNGSLSDTAKYHGNLTVARNGDEVVLTGSIAETLQSWYDDKKREIDEWHIESETSTEEFYLENIEDLDRQYSATKSECCVTSISEMLELMAASCNDVTDSADEKIEFTVNYNVSGNVKYPALFECPGWTRKNSGIAESGFRIEITDFSVEKQ